MEYVNLGATGLKVSRLCLGTMTYGSKKWREWVLDEEQSRPLLRRARSEEHTSELQSRLHLVCRLLLEKKKRAGSCRTGGCTRYVHVRSRRRRRSSLSSITSTTCTSPIGWLPKMLLRIDAACHQRRTC